MNKKNNNSVFEFAEMLLAQIIQIIEENTKNGIINFSNLNFKEKKILEAQKLPLFIIENDDIKWKNKYLIDFLDNSSIDNTSFSSVFYQIHKQQIEKCKAFNINVITQLFGTHIFINDNNKRFFYCNKNLKSSNLQIISIFDIDSLINVYNDLFANQLFLKKLFNSTSEMYFIVDENYNFLIKNKVFKKFQAKLDPRAEISQIDKLMLIEIKTHCQKVYESKKRQKIITSEIFGGKLLHIKRNYSPFIINGETYILAHYKDITTEMTTKNKLKKEIAFLHKFLDYTKIGYLFFNHKAELIAFNSRATTLLNTTLDYNIGTHTTFDKIKTCFSEDELNNLCAVDFSNENVKTIEIKIIKLQSVFYLKITKSLIKNKELKYLAYAIENITKQKKQTIELSKQNTFLKNLAAIGSNILNIDNREKLYENLNTALSNTLSNDCVIISFRHQSDKQAILDNLYIGKEFEKHFQNNNFTQNNIISTTDYQIFTLSKGKNIHKIKNTEQLIPILKPIGLELNDQSTLNYYLGNLINKANIYYSVIIISLELHHTLVSNFLESILNQYNSKLTSIIQLEKINAQKENAIELSMAKSDFVSNITHELKNPLNSLLGFSRLLEKRELEPKTKDYITIIRKNSEQLLSIIQDLSDISKIESNTLNIQFEKVDLLSIMEELQDLYENYKEINPNVVLNFKYSVHDTVNVNADFIRLKQILINFISNALKYTTDGIITVGYSAENEKVKVYVKDTGKGISEDNLKNLFKRYNRMSEVHSKKEGVGIGLSIAQELASKINTKIDVESKLGKGSTFSVKLNVYVEVKTKTEDIRKISKNGSNQELLVVEDDENTVKFYDFFLSELKINYTICRSAKEAENQIKKIKPDLIFCDVRMPHKNGIDFILENQASLKNIPLYFITADSAMDIKSKADKANCIKIIYKPINPEYLIKIIEKHGFKIESTL